MNHNLYSCSHWCFSNSDKTAQNCSCFDLTKIPSCSSLGTFLAVCCSTKDQTSAQQGRPRTWNVEEWGKGRPNKRRKIPAFSGIKLRSSVDVAVAEPPRWHLHHCWNWLNSEHAKKFPGFSTSTSPTASTSGGWRLKTSRRTGPSPASRSTAWDGTPRHRGSGSSRTWDRVWRGPATVTSSSWSLTTRGSSLPSGSER